jgi:hypothetical protein
MLECSAVTAVSVEAALLLLSDVLSELLHDITAIPAARIKRIFFI